MSPSNATLTSNTSPLARFDTDSEQLLPLLRPTARTTPYGSTLIDIVNQGEVKHVEMDPVIGDELWKMLALVYPVVCTVLCMARIAGHGVDC